VPRSLQTSLTQKSKNCLWFYRPELGNFVSSAELTSDQMMNEPNFDEVHSCFSEISCWTSSAYILGERKKAGIVDTWMQIINSLTEFGPLESQIVQAKQKLNSEEFIQLESKIVSLQTPLSWDEQKRRNWLRILDPQDYLWWIQMLGTNPNWNLDLWLRPMRRSMFKFAEENPAFEGWSEEQKKVSSSQILSTMRSIHLGEDEQNDVEAA
jgi:hypothetical protein